MNGRIPGAPNGQTPRQLPKWVENTLPTHLQHIDIVHGGVQFHGQRGPVRLLQDDVVYVTFAQMFAITASILQLLASDSPASSELRAHLAGVQLKKPEG